MAVCNESSRKSRARRGVYNVLECRDAVNEMTWYARSHVNSPSKSSTLSASSQVSLTSALERRQGTCGLAYGTTRHEAGIFVIVSKEHDSIMDCLGLT